MGYHLNFETGVVSLPLSALKRIGDGASKQNVRILCALIERGLDTRPYAEVSDEVCRVLGIAPTDLAIAEAFWCGAGVICEGDGEIASPTVKVKLDPTMKTGNEIEKVTSSNIRKWMEKDKAVSEFVKTCEDIFEKLFNQTELKIILTFSQEYHLPDGVIFAVLGYCHDNDYSISYAKSIFARFVDNGIVTLEAANAELEYLKGASSYENNVKKIFGISRALSSKEKKIVEEWNRKYHFAFDMIQEAFDKAVASGNDKGKIGYCDKILTDWHIKGYKSAEDVREKEKSGKKGKILDSSFSTQDFFEAAIARSYQQQNNKK